MGQARCPASWPICCWNAALLRNVWNQYTLSSLHQSFTVLPSLHIKWTLDSGKWGKDLLIQVFTLGTWPAYCTSTAHTHRRGGGGLGRERWWSVAAGGGVEKTVGSSKGGGGGSWWGLSHDLNSVWKSPSFPFFLSSTFLQTQTDHTDNKICIFGSRALAIYHFSNKRNDANEYKSMSDLCQNSFMDWDI